MPAEDFVYFGDTLRFPYGSRTQDELHLFARQIAIFLERTGVKLIVVACNSATAAALPALQEQFETPMIGAVMPGARAAVQSSRSRRVGVLATPATVASGSYVRAVHSLDMGVDVYQEACPDLATYIQEGEVASREVLDAVKRYTGPLKQRAVDVVIMGSTHYPHVAPMLQRAMGRGVTLVSPAAEIALEVEETLARQDVAQGDDREGEYRFYCTGDVETFRSVGARFLQMPLERVERVDPATLEPRV
jgi:glutamate racemase